MAVSGHSKGGNLALCGCSRLDCSIREQIAELLLLDSRD
ncbi:MAG: Mbeg1-like protein [Streptococcus sp.]